MLVTRSTEESHLYMCLHPCDCGEQDFAWFQHRIEEAHRRFRSIYWGECGRCGKERSFTFVLAAEPSPPPPAIGGSAPSTIIDPGEFLHTCQLFAASVPSDPAAVDDDQFYGAHDALTFAQANLDEAVKFLPTDADAIPTSAFRSAIGKRLYEADPAQFNRARLMALQESLAELRARYDAEFAG